MNTSPIPMTSDYSSQTTPTSSAALRPALEKRFLGSLRRPPTSRAGIELELPVYNLEPGAATDFASVHDAVGEFLSRFPFTETTRDDSGAIYRAADPATRDELSFDCSFNTLELSFGPDESILETKARFDRYYPALQSALGARGHALTGMGINPHWREIRPEPILNGRYRMLLHHLKSYTKYGGAPRFHDHPDFGLFSCASQVQLDVDESNVVPAINAFNSLEPFKAVLFSNSPFDFGAAAGGWSLCGRDRLWSRSLHGINPHNCGMFGIELRSIDDLIGYLETTSLYCVERDGKYLNFTPLPLCEYVRRRRIDAEYWDSAAGAYRNFTFAPSPDDVAWLRPFKFEDLTARGTLEFRSVCEQPVRDAFAPAAFHAGLMARLPELARLLAEDTSLYGHGFGSAELRDLMVRRKRPSFIDESALREQLHRILDIAEDGLAKRGFGEEALLAPLRTRAERLSNPALETLSRLDAGEPIDSIAADFGRLWP
ncbi:MAG: glutamylcysteine synthetase [Kiritimatiellae bacterium]|nr:glutamylcysteine synthetase [Kiritimatiellia bacterium]